MANLCLVLITVYFVTAGAQYNNGYFGYYLYGGPCLPQFRSTNPAACLDFMKKAAEDPKLFWFGAQQRAQCPGIPANSRNLTCQSSIPSGGDPDAFNSLGSRLFSDRNFNSSQMLGALNSVMTVTYNSPPGIWTGCNSSAYTARQFFFDINSNMLPLNTIHYRNPPNVQVPGCDLQNLCALMLIDAPRGIVHNVFPNFPKTGLTGYVKPTHPYANVANPYVWIAFKQNGSEIAVDKTSGFTPYELNLSSFIQQYNLTGPITMTWLMAVGDIHAIQYNSDTYGMSAEPNCAILLDSIIKQGFTLQQDLGINGPSELSVWVAARFTPSAATITNSISLQDGAQTYINGKYEIWLDPIANGIITAQPQSLPTKPDVFLTAKLDTPVSADLQGQLFTLILVRKDIGGMPFASPVSSGEVIVFWLVTNINGSDIENGFEQLPYIDVTSVADYSSTHHYILIFRQGGPINSVERYYKSDCAPLRPANRCRFPLPTFVLQNKLTLVGMSRFQLNSPFMG